MTAELATIVLIFCSSNSKCQDFMINCAIDKNGKIAQTKIEECADRYRDGERHEESETD